MSTGLTSTRPYFLPISDLTVMFGADTGSGSVVDPWAGLGLLAATQSDREQKSKAAVAPAADPAIWTDFEGTGDFKSDTIRPTTYTQTKPSATARSSGIDDWAEFTRALQSLPSQAAADISDGGCTIPPSVELRVGNGASGSSPSRRRSSDLDRQEAVAAIGPSITLDKPKNDHVPLRKLSFGGTSLSNDSSDACDTFVHKIKKNDTLAGIAILYHVTLSDLKKVNRLWHDDDIKLHDHLIIPGIRNQSIESESEQIPRASNSKAQRRSSSAPNLEPVPETTEDLLRQIDADLQSTISTLGHESWRTNKDDVLRIGRELSSNSEPVFAMNKGPSDQVRRGRLGSLESVLGRSKPEDDTFSNPLAAVGQWNNWIHSKLKSVSKELISPRREEYSPIASDVDVDEFVFSAYKPPSPARRAALPYGLRRRTSSGTSSDDSGYLNSEPESITEGGRAQARIAATGRVMTDPVDLLS